MARRWTGPILQQSITKSLASHYASQLRALHSLCETDPEFEIDVLGYSSDSLQNPVSASPSNSLGQPTNSQNQTHFQREDVTDSGSRPHFEVFSPGTTGLTSGGMGQSLHLTQQPGFMTSDESQPDRLAAISHTLMNEDFLAMDRIITLDDMIFAAPTGTPLTWMTDNNGQMG